MNVISAWFKRYLAESSGGHPGTAVGGRFRHDHAAGADPGAGHRWDRHRLSVGGGDRIPGALSYPALAGGDYRLLGVFRLLGLLAVRAAAPAIRADHAVLSGASEHDCEGTTAPSQTARAVSGDGVRGVGARDYYRHPQSGGGFGARRSCLTRWRSSRTSSRCWYT